MNTISMSPCDLGEGKSEGWRKGKEGMRMKSESWREGMRMKSESWRKGMDGRVERLLCCKTRKGSINHQPNCKSCSPPIQMSLPLCHFRFLSSLYSSSPTSPSFVFQVYQFSIYTLDCAFLRKKGFLFQEQQIHQSEVFWLEELSLPLSLSL